MENLEKMCYLNLHDAKTQASMKQANMKARMQVCKQEDD